MILALIRRLFTWIGLRLGVINWVDVAVTNKEES